MIAFCGAPFTFASYGIMPVPKLNFAYFLIVASEPDEFVMIPQSPL